MKIIYDYEKGIESSVVLTFGNFDGVHSGHAFAISTVKKIARERGLPSAVLTFEPHPSTTLFNRNNFRLIDHEQKKELISSYGVDYLYIINFNEDFSKVSCNDFISKILVGKYNVMHIIVGDNCTFGHKRLGNILTLEKNSEMYGYSLTKLEPLIICGEICSSSLIREYVQTGKIEIANKLLGRPYQISGIVKEGAHRGEKIGFPTINVVIENCMIKPKFGAYNAIVTSDGTNWLHGAVNIGMRPTFGDLKKPIVEMHIFDFCSKLYGFKVEIQLLKFIRPERKFKNVYELKEQINHDIYQIKKCL
ncbi:riboflavin biosynthesis protein RibF [Wolbachia endosymbiont of Pentidionis agamae]|uniref:riboflavin biosynthesis protein RibF n=1 Tax=Wolbachia endosymbiont of Pentidionis agamae TaxID=3110435 RepID=UPI002FCED9AE